MEQNYNNNPSGQPQQPQWQSPSEPQQPQWQAPQQQQPQWQAPSGPQWQAPNDQQWQAPDSQQWQEPNQPAEYPLNPQPAKKKKGSALVWLIVAISVLALAAVGAALYFFLWQTPDTPAPRHVIEEEEEEYVDEPSDLDDDSAYDISAEEEADLATDEPTDEELEPQPISEAVSSQLNLTGDADGNALSLKLNIGSDGRVTGEYNDLQNNRTVSVSGTKSNDVITLQGRGAGRSYNFRIVPSGHIYTGTLRTGSGQAKELHLTAR